MIDADALKRDLDQRFGNSLAEASLLPIAETTPKPRQETCIEVQRLAGGSGYMQQ
ncbi:hypothetical protein [Mesorhizobium sangaii]|uniref:Uncharacterized protein n=1 Tax=Mesorhizobium sangaii TaxID=505389 RepID=A0A841PG70_9HYPH|nr:hypothetical protein [Mesorhizobium sangaii]MBB6414284.1 hypothetical protein [Mesorhizobium sangaii]